jgi:hypothetical protein
MALIWLLPDKYLLNRYAADGSFFAKNGISFRRALIRGPCLLRLSGVASGGCLGARWLRAGVVPPFQWKPTPQGSALSIGPRVGNL